MASLRLPGLVTCGQFTTHGTRTPPSQVLPLFPRSGAFTARGVPFKGTYLPGKWIEPTTDDTLLWSGSEAAWPFSARAKPAPRGHTAQFKGWGGGKVLMVAEYISVQVLVTLQWGTAAMLAALLLFGVLALLFIMSRFMNLSTVFGGARA